ncbi:hypothetical protein [Flavobacterium sp. KJJ]|uniref:hypothetical protein n=1 Tax=Flavobacterium sp. KJJ TaxID=1270193 RepID=UPI0006900165|nr:hypothetical protein [Flavobacterium sp. KJJ]
MKKIILLFILLNGYVNFGQNKFDPNGNVGLGTLDPLVKLDVIGAGRFRVPDDQSGIGGLTIETIGGTNLKIGGNFNYSWIQSHASLPLYINELGNNTIINPQYGNVGIGTTNPDAKLSVNGDARIKQNLFISGSSGGYTTGDNPVLYFGVAGNFSKINVPFGDKMILSSYHGYTFNTSYNGSTPITALTIGITGDVGVGTTTPDAKLAVNGTIHSKEVKVDLTGWSDYVFKKLYTLPTLEEVEKHIAEKGHLENIPSEEEVLKNGINLGEMNAKLLQKIEELTLYVVEQNKKIIDLESRLKKVEAN